MEKAKGLHILFERIRRLTKLQSQGAEEWFRWLHYGPSLDMGGSELIPEISRQSAADPSTDQVPAAMHDVKSVWMYLKSGFNDPPLANHFPGPVDPVDLPSELYAQQPVKPLDFDETVRVTLNKLDGSTSSIIETPAPPTTSTPKKSDDSIDSSNLDMTIEMEEDDPSFLSRRSSFSSSGTAERKIPEAVQIRKPELEPMVWAKSLLESCKGVFTSPQSGPISNEVKISRLMGNDRIIVSKRIIEDEVWMVTTDPEDLSNCTADKCQVVWILRFPSTGDIEPCLIGAYTLQPGTRCTCLEFFDNDEFVLTLHRGLDVYLVTCLRSNFEPSQGVPFRSGEEWVFRDLYDHLDTAFVSLSFPS